MRDLHYFLWCTQGSHVSLHQVRFVQSVLRGSTFDRSSVPFGTLAWHEVVSKHVRSVALSISVKMSSQALLCSF